MATLLDLTANQPVETLADGAVLIAEGAAGGDMFVLESGQLEVGRGGVELAVITQPGTMVGEMAVLLGKPASATVRAKGEVRVRALRKARAALESEPSLAFYVAGILAGRLDATSAVLVDLARQHAGKPAQTGIFARIFKALNASDEVLVERPDLFSATMMWPLM